MSAKAKVLRRVKMKVGNIKHSTKSSFFPDVFRPQHISPSSSTIRTGICLRCEYSVSFCVCMCVLFNEWDCWLVFTWMQPRLNNYKPPSDIIIKFCLHCIKCVSSVSYRRCFKQLLHGWDTRVCASVCVYWQPWSNQWQQQSSIVRMALVIYVRCSPDLIKCHSESHLTVAFVALALRYYHVVSNKQQTHNL